MIEFHKSCLKMIRFIDALEVYYMRVWDLSVFLNNKIHHQKTMVSFHQAHNQLKLSRIKKNEEPKTPNNKSIFLEAGKLNAITLMFFFILFFFLVILLLNSLLQQHYRKSISYGYSTI
jgi:hypothetical protein